MWARSQGVGRVCQRTFVDTYSKGGMRKLYTTKTPITAADLLNDKGFALVCCLYMGDNQDVYQPLARVLRQVKRMTMSFYLGVSGIEHTKDQSSASPDQRDMRTLPQDHFSMNFYQVAFPEEDL